MCRVQKLIAAVAITGTLCLYPLWGGAATPVSDPTLQLMHGKLSQLLPPPAQNEHKRVWNLRDVDIRAVINEVAQETGKNFIIDPRVQGKVTVISAVPLGADEIYQVLLSILQIHGFAAVPSGQVIKIVPSLYAKQLTTPVVNGLHPGHGDSIVVRVFPVKYNSAEQMVPALRPLMPTSAQLSVYLPTNSLIIAGRATNVERVVDVAKHMDVASSHKVDVLPLKNAIAADVIKELSTLKGLNANGMPPIRLSADDRSNAVMVSGNTQQRMKVRTLVDRLDQIGASTISGNTQVIFLHYLKAKEILPVLASVAGASIGGQSGYSAGNINSSGNSNANEEDDSEGGAEEGAASAGAAATVPSGQARAQVMGPGLMSAHPLEVKRQHVATISVGQGAKRVQISAEPVTNSVVITAPQSVMRTLRSVVDRLDLRPAQVLVEAAVVEIDEDKLRELGVMWGTPKANGDATPTITGDTRFMSLTGGYGVGLIQSGNFRWLVQALQRDTHTNILATPDIIVMDNQTADIRVGQRLPYQEGSYSTNTPNTLNQPYSTFSYKFVGLELKVIPQINEGSSVRLTIEQGNASLASNANATQPTTNESHIKTSVLVDNGEILVLGGLISNQLIETIHKIPILGDIPGVGRLFKNKSHSYQKRNLMVFIHPVILQTKHDNIYVTSAKYHFARDRELLAQERVLNSAFKVTPGVLPAMAASRTHLVALPKPFSHDTLVDGHR